MMNIKNPNGAVQKTKQKNGTKKELDRVRTDGEKPND